MPRRVIWRGLSGVTSRPPNVMVPELGLRYPVTMLMKVVLPAPLLPINPTTASCSTATLMSLAAVTAPKVLFSPCAWRTIATSGRLATAREQRPQAAGQEHDHHQHGNAECHLPGIRRIFIGKTADGLEDERAEERGEDAAGAGQDADEHKLAGRCPVRHFGIDVTDGDRRERAAHAGEHRGDHIIDMNDIAHRRPHVFDPQLVVADRLRQPPHVRVQILVHEGAGIKSEYNGQCITYVTLHRCSPDCN